MAATLFGHPMAASGFTLSDRSADVRRFWIDHVRRCRSIGAELGQRLGSACVHDLWVPDGMKDECVDRLEPTRGWIRLRIPRDEVRSVDSTTFFTPTA